MKKILFVVLSFLLFASCNSHQRTDTFDLVAYGDNSATESHISGTFVFGCGGVSGSSKEILQYRVMILDSKTNDIYPVILNSKYTHIRIIDSTQNPKISITYSTCNEDNRCVLPTIQKFQGLPEEDYFSYTLYIPKNSITYSNSFDGL